MKYSDRINIADYVASDMTEGEVHLRAFMSAVNEGIQPEMETMKFLERAFKDILKGENTDKALRLETKQGTKRAAAKVAAYNKSMKWAVMVEEKILQGMTPDEARQAVCNVTGKKYKTIRTHHKDNAAAARAMINAFDKLDALKEKRKRKDKK